MSYAAGRPLEPPLESKDATALAQALVEVENLDSLRLGLAAGLEGATEPPTSETFKQVCRPVGLRAKALSQAYGWQVKQLARQYRNPDHALDTPQAEQVFEQFRQNTQLTGLWEPATVGSRQGIRYYRRINVEPSCLACHGLRIQRPAFIEQQYPQDRAYDFKAGDLRGMYAVFIPSAPQSVEAAVEPGVAP